MKRGRMGATWAALRLDIAVSMPRVAAEGGKGGLKQCALGWRDFWDVVSPPRW